MGIRGLRSYIMRHPRRHEFMRQLGPYLSGECVLIIEAPNMMHTFHQHLGLDSVCGGQYEEFYQAVVEFFSALKRENPLMKVLVLLVEVTELEKLDVIKERKLYKLKQWAETVRNAEPSSLIPTSLDEVFQQAIMACGVGTLFYDSEADDYISALALHYARDGRNVFILSEDTDFYVTAGITGVICMESISWSSVSRSRPNLRESLFFSLPDFLRVNSCQTWMIPVLALILGNDITPQHLQQALQPVKTNFSSYGRGHFLNKIIFYLSRYAPSEKDALTSMKSYLEKEMLELFDRTYEFNKNRYLCPIRNVDPGDIPTAQLKKIKRFYPGVREDNLLRIGHFWSNRMLLVNNAFFNAEDYNQPAACLASKQIRSYCHGILLLPTGTTMTSLPSHITEITRVKSGNLIGGEDTSGNVIVDEKLVVLYKCGIFELPNLSQVQEMSRHDRMHILRIITHSTNCSVVFCEREYIDYSVSVIISTLYYWYHQISFYETKIVSPATPLSTLNRQSLLRSLLISSLVTYFRDRILLPPTKLPSLKRATKHMFYHSVAEWTKIHKDTNTLLTLLDLPVVSARRCYDGALLFSIITDPDYSKIAESAITGLIKDELYNIFQSLLSSIV